MALDGEFDSVLAAARTGASWALAALYRGLHPAVLRYLRAQEPGEGEDLAADAWIDVASGLHRFDGAEDDFRRWVFTIARRRLIDHRRARTRRRTAPVPAEDLVLLAGEGDTESEAVQALRVEAALARVATLPPGQAEVVLLRVVGGFTAEEVGRIMGRRPGTVRVLQHRALRALAARFEPGTVAAESRPGEPLVDS